MKKGQTTIFIILAIVIIIIIAVFLFLKDTTEDRGRNYFVEQGLQPSINNVQNFIVDCLEINAKDAVVKIGIQGGYFNKPSNFFDMQWAFIPYYYDQGTFLQPTQQQIETELSNYVDSNMEKCLSKIEFKNLELKYQPSSTKATIQPSFVRFTSKLPTIIEHEGNTVIFDLDQHPVAINSSLKEIIEVATFITNSHKENPDLMCINCITELAKERKLYVDFIAFEEDTTLVMILENRTMEHPYIFEFLNRYAI
jgi:hypothetical protein|tara:strand:- start:238 stop:996 length:759 start_codon:yes stop_codon:yes gene_type:complete